MMEPHDDEQAVALLHAAERSLFDATVRLEQAVMALGRQPRVNASARTLEQARLWSSLIQAGLEKLGRRTVAA
jgi:hypothetical protein